MWGHDCRCDGVVRSLTPIACVVLFLELRDTGLKFKKAKQGAFCPCLLESGTADLQYQAENSNKLHCVG